MQAIGVKLASEALMPQLLEGGHTLDLALVDGTRRQRVQGIRE